LLGAIAGHDPKDLTTVPDPVPDYTATGDIRGLRIGIDVRWNAEDVDRSVREALRTASVIFTELGAVQVDVTAPDVAQVLRASGL
jgi:Asp-tRNA(Asn)/Glu-tRNA(Gln) amidotransferase A subunit family amidase